MKKIIYHFNDIGSKKQGISKIAIIEVEENEEPIFFGSDDN